MRPLVVNVTFPVVVVVVVGRDADQIDRGETHAALGPHGVGERPHRPTAPP